MSDIERNISTDDVCALFDVDTRTVTRWVTSGCPCDRSGKARKFNAGEVAAWMKENGITGERGRPLDPNDQLKAAKIRKESALAERYEIELARAKALLVSKAEVEAGNITKFTVIRNKLMGMASSLAPSLEGLSVPEIERQIEARVVTVLKELSKE
jgi:phage terminase Nu1 subunit (DNA packaging protein)